METIKELLEQFKYLANNPRKQLDKYLAAGKKAVGIFPYYAPEEIVYAAGIAPFGVWGGQGPIERAKNTSRHSITRWHCAVWKWPWTVPSTGFPLQC